MHIYNVLRHYTSLSINSKGGRWGPKPIRSQHLIYSIVIETKGYCVRYIQVYLVTGIYNEA